MEIQIATVTHSVRLLTGVGRNQEEEGLLLNNPSNTTSPELTTGDVDGGDGIPPQDDGDLDFMEDPIEAEKDIEEWEEATAEHDKEWFEEFEREHEDKKDDETLEDIEEELTKEEKEAEMEDEAENKELDKEGFIDGTGTKDTGDEDDQQTIVPESDGGMHDMQDMTMEPHEIPSEVDRKKVWTGEGEGMGMDMDMEMGDDDINNEPPPVPSPTHQNAPVQPAPSSNHIFSACSGLSCPLVNAYQDHPLPVLVVLALVPLFLLCCLRKYCCRSKSAGDARGAYRAVAARYGDMAYDNTFSDTLSDDEDDDFHNGNGDIEDDSWGRSGKRSLQMSNLGRKRNDGLSLEEMNG